MLISKKFTFGLALLALAGLLTFGFQKGWIGKRAAESTTSKTPSAVGIELADSDVAIAQKK